MPAKKKLTVKEILEIVDSVTQDHGASCYCDYPDEGEDGIIMSLACQLRDELGLPPFKGHKS